MDQPQVLPVQHAESQPSWQEPSLSDAIQESEEPQILKPYRDKGKGKGKGKAPEWALPDYSELKDMSMQYTSSLSADPTEFENDDMIAFSAAQQDELEAERKAIQLKAKILEQRKITKSMSSGFSVGLRRKIKSFCTNAHYLCGGPLEMVIDDLLENIDVEAVCLRSRAESMENNSMANSSGTASSSLTDAEEPATPRLRPAELPVEDTPGPSPMESDGPADIVPEHPGLCGSDALMKHLHILLVLNKDLRETELQIMRAKVRRSEIEVKVLSRRLGKDGSDNITQMLDRIYGGDDEYDPELELAMMLSMETASHVNGETSSSSTLNDFPLFPHDFPLSTEMMTGDNVQSSQTHAQQLQA